MNGSFNCFRIDEFGMIEKDQCKASMLIMSKIKYIKQSKD